MVVERDDHRDREREHDCMTAVGAGTGYTEARIHTKVQVAADLKNMRRMRGVARQNIELVGRRRMHKEQVEGASYKSRTVVAEVNVLNIHTENILEVEGGRLVVETNSLVDEVDTTVRHRGSKSLGRSFCLLRACQSIEKMEW